ncbi:DHBP synthase RibB-like alpha/beta domain-containing protein [Aspergillus coremiiformis]|uniref:Threonylcarbamoyl-AMP synthase n=1 Tax=Aspergillus coremiiformis TaxID=138285 RepID=A0A5N6Z8S5_9EURO|nr:DHBP synthase RibB-like alpha/beta domain-containing protein [Aspergillus coremiiformis]
MEIKSKIIPAPGCRPDVKSDALRVFEVLRSGGLALVPTEVGYGLMASSTEAIQKAFAAKKRRPGHAQGVIGTYQLHRELHILPDEKLEMVRTLHQDLDMSFAIVAPFRSDHPILQQLTPATLANTTKNGTLGIYIGGGSLLAELGRLNDEAGQLMLGSSANLTGTGQKFRVEDIDQEIKDAADIIVDYGLQRYHIYGGRPSTIVDFDNMKVLRVGSSYELLRERLRKYWDVVLPEDPMFDVSSPRTLEPEEKPKGETTKGSQMVTGVQEAKKGYRQRLLGRFRRSKENY